MNEEAPIVNRVNASSLVTFDLEDFYTPGERILLDIKDQLYKDLILREKDFRDYIKNTDWSSYSHKFVAITCSNEAIVPTWAYMILGVALQPFASQIIFGNLEQLEEHLFRLKLSSVNWEKYTGQRVVVKGCSKYVVPPSLYVDVAVKLRPVVVSLMFGEPCSTVPLYKKKLA
jgi:hypothetical protein